MFEYITYFCCQTAIFLIFYNQISIYHYSLFSLALSLRWYVFKEKGIKGEKDILYLDLGFNIDDSAFLAMEYERQAKEKYTNGEYVLNRKDEYGQRVDIVIELTGNGKTRKMLSGWMVHPLGLITSATPFSGYVR